MTNKAAASDVLLDRLLTLHPKLIDLTLDRVWRILKALGNPQNQIGNVVHIAGTNGKGSTLAMIRAGLEAAGFSVNAYISPHLVRFHERITLRGNLISEDALSCILEECERANDGLPITFFEITTAAAFLAFARQPADFTLLETGLGGRLDATNVFDRPRATVITPIAMDHQQFLGDTLKAIAGEKAGIIKREVPCITAVQHEEVLEVLQDRAAELGSPLLTGGQDWIARAEHGRLVYQDHRGLLDLDPPALLGSHQYQNAGTALATLRCLGIDDTACQQAVSGANWPARMQRLTRGPLVDLVPKGTEVWLDGGHNPAAGEAVAAVMDDWHARDSRPVHMICGMLETKSAVDYLRPLVPRIAGIQTVAIPDSNATYSAEALAGIVTSLGGSCRPTKSVLAAMRTISVEASAPYRVLICGSLYLAGAVLTENS